MGSATRSTAPSQPRLLAIIELQNAIAAAAMNADEVMHIVAERAATLTTATAAMVALVEGDDLVVRTVLGAARAPMVGTRLRRSGSVAGRCVAERRALRIDDEAADHTADGELGGRTGTASVACVPLLYGETAVGVLEVASARPAAFSEEDVETLRVLGQIIAIALHRAYTYPRPRYDSLQDAQTGLGNRRAFDERLDAELNRHRRFRHSFSLALVKLAGLETATDRLGQAAGDDMLRRVATILKQHTRMIDGCFRILADELAIVMPGTSLDGARIVAERCRDHSLESRACDSSVRLGFGVVAAVEGETAVEITARANAALDYEGAATREAAQLADRATD
jgi:diguanylate cyclase (GGDEF)-like protein